jgi:hypothetical protein
MSPGRVSSDSAPWLLNDDDGDDDHYYKGKCKITPVLKHDAVDCE